MSLEPENKICVEVSNSPFSITIGSLQISVAPRQRLEPRALLKQRVADKYHKDIDLILQHSEVSEAELLHAVAKDALAFHGDAVERHGMLFNYWMGGVLFVFLLICVCLLCFAPLCGCVKPLGQASMGFSVAILGMVMLAVIKHFFEPQRTARLAMVALQQAKQGH